LTSEYQPLTESEIAEEVRNYAEFCANYNLEKAARNKISYVVVDADYNQDFSNLNHWYDRGESERLGRFLLYRVKLKQN
jgi:hypothetical protein